MVTWNGEKIADNGFLINLERRKDRLNESLIEFGKLKIEGISVFRAIDSLEQPELEYMACAESHLQILKMQVENGWDKIIIFEDDFFTDIDDSLNYNSTIAKIIKTINNEIYDLLFLGTVLTNESSTQNENLIKPSTLIQTTCYVIRISFSNFVINNYNFKDANSIMINENIDTFYSILSSKEIGWKNVESYEDSEKLLNNKFKIFCTNPIIFNQRPSYSDIQHRYSNHSSGNKLRNLKFYPKN